MSDARIKRHSPGEDTPGGYMRTVDPLIGAIPQIDPDLVRHLRAMFPVTQSRSHTLRDYDVQVGQGEVIAYIEKLWKSQQS